MKHKLMGIDLDGTLLTDNKTIDRRDIEAIQRAAAQGVKIALITGRMPAATRDITRALGVPCILCCNAGTYILEGKNCLKARYLPVKAMIAVYQIIEKYQIPLWIFRHEKWMVTAEDAYTKEESHLVHYVPEVVDIDELAGRWAAEGTGPNKLLIGTDADRVQRIYAELKAVNRQETDMACSSEHFLEIYPKGWNKGRALEVICEKEKIRSKEAVAFGDQELDIPMLAAAGTAVAMGNAIDEAKEIADFVTKTNNEAGIAYAIENFL